MATSAVSSVEPGGEGGGPRKEAAQGARGGGAKEHRLSTSLVPDDLASWS